MLNLYQEIIMDHYKNPRNRGSLSGASFVAQQHNSSCGDEITCSGIVEQDILHEVRFDGKGCVISQATASLLSEKVKGMRLDDINAINSNDVIALIGMNLGLVRMQCALLALIALQKGLKN